MMFSVTNENIYILERLIGPNEEDNILSICSSGDIPFMLLVWSKSFSSR